VYATGGFDGSSNNQKHCSCLAFPTIDKGTFEPLVATATMRVILSFDFICFAPQDIHLASLLQ